MTQQPVIRPAAQNNDEIDLGRLLGVLVDHKWLIIAITAAFAFIGIAYAILATPIYRADALIQVEQASPSNPLADVTSLLGKEPPSQAEIEIIRSRMVLGRAVDILNLDLIIEPARLPLLGNFLNRIGTERPGIFRRAGYTWAGEELSVTDLAVTDDLLGENFRLKVESEQTYSLHYDGAELGEGRAG